MECIHTLKHAAPFELQTDVYLIQGNIARVAGPDRAYLNLAKTGETAAIWLTNNAAAELIERVLAVGDPEQCRDKPWQMHWVRDGVLTVKNHLLGLDRGVHLLIELRGYDLLDRVAHLFEGGDSGSA